MATFKELFGEKYNPEMTLLEAEKLFEGKRFADLSTGEYVSKAKYDDDTKQLADYKAQAEGKQAEIKRRRGSFDLKTLSAFQRAEYDKALSQQIFYVLTEGDFHMMSGFDVVTNTYTKKSDLKKRYIAPAAMETLTAAGLFYSALNGGSHLCRRRII